eukprot:6970179-Heterocapsa_arctica.AAC.1
MAFVSLGDKAGETEKADFKFYERDVISSKDNFNCRLRNFIRHRVTILPTDGNWGRDKGDKSESEEEVAPVNTRDILQRSDNERPPLKR